MSDGTFAGYLAAWREAQPQRAVAWLFLHHDERVRYGGLACLLQEWLKAAREISEPQVAAAKLGWWREEMQRATQGETRHPLTQELFADRRVQRVPAALWTAAVDAAVLAIDAAPAPDFAAQAAAVAPLAHAFAALETRVAFGTGVASARAAAVWSVGLRLADLRALVNAVQRGRSPLPMHLLARHGMLREGLLEDSPARRAALRDGVGEFAHALDAAAKMDGPLALFRDVQLRADRHALAVALRAAEPLAALRQPRSRLRDVLKTWHAARMSRHMTYGEDSDASA